MNSELEFFHDDVESDIIFVKSLSLVSDLVQNFDVSSQKMTQYFFRNDEPSSVCRDWIEVARTQDGVKILANEDNGLKIED